MLNVFCVAGMLVFTGTVDIKRADAYNPDEIVRSTLRLLVAWK